MLGEKIIVNIPDNTKMKLTIPECCKSGTKLKIRGKGICGHDYYIVVNPKFPNKLSPKEKKIIKELKSEENGN